MKIEKVTIHNFRSIREQPFVLGDYSILIGANNSGKTNVIDAIRIFYEKELKFNAARDFPKFKPDDEESWIEIHFRLDETEYESLKDEYKMPDKVLRVRKYLKSSDAERVKANQSNIYGYEGEKLSATLFYGAKNISEAKLGDILYIPEVTKIDEYTKLSGPSAFRNLLEFVVKKVTKGSKAFEKLGNSFEAFNAEFKAEASREGVSLQKLIDDINDQIREWDAKFGIEINQIRPEEVIKTLISHYLQDGALKDERLDITAFGQGFQRHLIYTLITLSGKYKEVPAKKEKKEFAPEFVLILFEEPEAFLHPAQQENLNFSLERISSGEGRQVLISTHSTHFASRNVDDLPSLLRLGKRGPETIVFHIDDTRLQEIFEANEGLKAILGEEVTDKDLEYDSIRYSLWLDPDRCSAFFADNVLICEGLSEKALIDTLVKEGRIELTSSRVYVLNAGGKFDIHKYMNLFGKLGIEHSVLFDRDTDSGKHAKINDFIKKNANSYTRHIMPLDGEFEDFLGIPPVEEKYRKPLNVLWHYRTGKIGEEKIKELSRVVKNLISEDGGESVGNSH
jgi:putative ATP-dependent endonuclease of OLD family